MKRIIKMMITIFIICTMLICAYCFGTTQAKTEFVTVTEFKTVNKVVEIVPNNYIDTTSEEFFDNYIDMRTVSNFETTENGLYLYLNDGNGYYWER